MFTVEAFSRLHDYGHPSSANPVDMMTSSNGNIFRVTGPLWGKSTGDRWIPYTKPSDTELWANNRDAIDLRRHRPHYDVTVKQDLHLAIAVPAADFLAATDDTPSIGTALFKMAEVISEDMGILDGLISIKISKRSYIGGNASNDTGQFNVWSTGGSGGHHKLKTQNCHDTNFVVTDGAGSVCPGQCWSYITPPKTILLPTHRDSRGIVNPRSDEER